MQQKHTQKLAKFLDYVLGRKPDEFGLVPEDQGYVSIKELLKALNQEEGWRHVRMAHLNEVALTVVPCPIEIEDKRIRAQDRSRLPEIAPANNLPKLLYIAVRNRAYPVICEKGLHSAGRPYLLLSSDKQMAARIGQRRDHHPVMLTVQVARSMNRGTVYQSYGQGLYMADTISTDSFSGPPLPKEKPTRAVKQEPVATQPKTPGSYFPDLWPPDEPKRPRRKEKDWKKDRRLARRHKSKRR